MASLTVPGPKVSTVLASNPKRSHIVTSFLRSSSKPNSVFKTVVEKASQVEIVDKSQDDYAVPDESVLSTFMTRVADLVMLVDSMDIVELQLKQMGCEVLIKKKEALPQPQVAAPIYAPPQTYQAMPMPQMPPANAPAPVASAAPASVSKPAALVKPSSSHPPFKCPMAGKFYRSPGPGALPFVKADHSGTVVEILVDDGKPVSVDVPLFIIEP